MKIDDIHVEQIYYLKPGLKGRDPCTPYPVEVLDIHYAGPFKGDVIVRYVNSGLVHTTNPRNLWLEEDAMRVHDAAKLDLQRHREAYDIRQGKMDALSATAGSLQVKFLENGSLDEVFIRVPSDRLAEIAALLGSTR